MIVIQESINDLHLKVENQIDKVDKEVRSLDNHIEVQKMYRENGLFKDEIQNEWWLLEQ